MEAMMCAQAFYWPRFESNWQIGIHSQRDFDEAASSHASTATRRRERVTKEWTMLVLSRKKNESIVINNDITIVVVEIRGDKVRLGVEAPKEVPVHRREVYDAIKRNEQATREGESTE
jgi:carbon storage regulator